MENQRKSNNQIVEDIKEYRVKVQNPKGIQKVQSVEDCIKTVIQKSKSVARLTRENLLGPLTSTIHKMYVVLFPSLEVKTLIE